MSFEIQFLGGTGTVTGSKYLLAYRNRKILVDCGLFQGLKSLRQRNWEPFPIKAGEIDAILLTHAHIDHSGYIPRLIKEGFKGKIYCTEATRETCKILLPDCGYLQEEEAAYLNRKGRTKHKPALPLFTEAEAEAALAFFVDVPFEEKRNLDFDLGFEFRYAGHILGAASLVVTLDGSRIAFTGDIGRMQDKIFYPPSLLPPVDYLVTESTYGNRLHKKSDPMEELAKAVNDTYDHGGVILVPAFAVGRAQSLLFDLSALRKAKRIPEFPMYLNSPMATDFTAVFRKFRELHKLSESECAELSSVVKFVRTPEESKSLNERKGPMLILSASGMLTGGRILHHVKAFAPFSQNTILLTGFQAAGTRGEALQNGAEQIKIHGEYVPVKAQIKILDNTSAHADYGEIIEWFQKSKIQPRQVFVTHGEPSAADELRRRLTENFGWNCSVPELGAKVRLE